MGVLTRAAIRVVLAAAAVSPSPLAAAADGVATARLSVGVTPEHRAAMLQAFTGSLEPLLRAHGMAPSVVPAAVPPDSVCSWSFTLPSADGYVEAARSLGTDTLVQATVRDLLARFGNGRRPPILSLVDAPLAGAVTAAGAGRRLPAGGGTRSGPWHRLGVADGLPDPAVICVFQDHQGNVWLGTDGGGVSRFDGEEITTFTVADGLADNIVSTILQDRDGVMWFGTGTYRSRTRGGGLSRYDGSTFTTFDSRHGLGHDTILALAEGTDGDLWFSTLGGGVSRFDGRRLVSYDWSDGLAGSYVLALARTPDGAMWLGTEAGLARFDGRAFTHRGRADGLVADTVTCLLAEDDGGLWVGTRGGVSHLQGERCVNLTPRDGLAGSHVTSLMRDRGGNLWFGTWHDGVSRWDGRRFTRFGPEDGLAHWRVLSMLADAAGDLWFGGGGEDASGNGVSRYTGDELVTFSTQEGLSADEVMCLAEDRQGRLWAGTWSGVDWFDGERFRPLPGVATNVRAIVEDRGGALWFGTIDQGVYRLQDGLLTHFTTADGLVSDWVESLAEDARGDLWFGTFYGVSRYDGTRWTTFTAADGLGGNAVEAILADADSAVWFGTGGGGARQEGALSRYDGSRWTSMTPADGLPEGRITALARGADGSLWLGTEGRGVSRFDGSTFMTYSPADGLGSNKVFHILVDGDGDLWFSAYGGGVSRFDGTAFQSLLERDGLAHDGTQQVLQDRHGDIWIATEGGLTRFRPRHVAPTVSVTQVTTDRDHGPVTAVDLTTAPGRVSFELLGGSFRTRPGQMLYRYRLDGHDAAWSQTRRRQVSYSDLPAGDYTFQVRAVDRDLNPSAPASVGVHVHRDNERLAWLAALIPALALVLGQTVRVLRRDRWLRQANAALTSANRQILEADRRKSEFLSRMSHDLRTPMNAIVGYTRILLRRARGVLDERQYRNLQNIGISADHLLVLINDILDLSRVEAGRIVLTPEPLDVPRLVDDCIASVAPLLRPGVALERRFDPVAPLFTDADRLRRVLVNLLSNAVKFTHAGSITVALRVVDGWHELAIADTGIGIAAEELPAVFDEFRQVGTRPAGSPEGSGLGLAIARRSVEILGGSIGVDSRLGAGSCFTVRLRDYRPAGTDAPG